MKIQVLAKVAQARGKFRNLYFLDRFFPRMSGFGVSWRRQRPGWLSTNARHGNSILNNEQHLFTLAGRREKAEEK
jgi:hypothetical protein